MSDTRLEISSSQFDVTKLQIKLLMSNQLSHVSQKVRNAFLLIIICYLLIKPYLIKA